MWLKRISELKINMKKNKLTPLGMVDNLEELVFELDC